MPVRPLHPCSRPGCGQLTAVRFCPAHATAHEREQAQHRGTSHERGYGARWQRVSRGFLDAYPLCHYCGLLGRVEAATSVDHATPPTGPADARFWDHSNWRPACHRCNSAKRDRTEAQYLAALGLPCPAEGRGG